MALPAHRKIRLLVDTGASCSCIDSQILASLAIAPTGTAPIHTPSTGGVPYTCSQYDVSIIIFDVVQNHTLPVVPIIESDFTAQGIDGLLRRDILSKMLLIYDGKAARFTLSY